VADLPQTAVATTKSGGDSRCAGGGDGDHVQGHWAIENGLHWCLDVAFREDANRTRDANAGANPGMVRRVAASLLKRDPGKGSIKAKRPSAAMDTTYHEKVLQGFKADSLRWPWCSGKACVSA
jgi:hypothetical protein